jgi:hypothetical protein
VADAQQKGYGQSDPSLTYQAEAAGIGRGLLVGEHLGGDLCRTRGELVGSYAIEQGSVMEDNNPDCAIFYQGADVRISAQKVSAPKTPRMQQPAVDYPRPIGLTDGEPSAFRIGKRQWIVLVAEGNV